MAKRSVLETIRLTTAQALVKYLQVQFSERDGETRRLIPGIFGIFGHGNVAGLSQALVEHGQSLRYYQARNEQPSIYACLCFLYRTRLNQHVKRSCAGHDQSASRSASSG
jgi:3D-(3,5/4)-trihydroxycyclohexane-1,2-dione acylhydrolase (decyclizing)